MTVSIESTDPKAMYRWTAQWADLLPLTVTPCLEDADAGEGRHYPGVDFQILSQPPRPEFGQRWHQMLSCQQFIQGWRTSI